MQPQSNVTVTIPIKLFLMLITRGLNLARERERERSQARAKRQTVMVESAMQVRVVLIGAYKTCNISRNYSSLKPTSAINQHDVIVGKGAGERTFRCIAIVLLSLYLGARIILRRFYFMNFRRGNLGFNYIRIELLLYIPQMANKLRVFQGLG